MDPSATDVHTSPGAEPTNPRGSFHSTWYSRLTPSPETPCSFDDNATEGPDNNWAQRLPVRTSPDPFPHWKITKNSTAFTERICARIRTSVDKAVHFQRTTSFPPHWTRRPGLRKHPPEQRTRLGAGTTAQDNLRAAPGSGSTTLQRYPHPHFLPHMPGMRSHAPPAARQNPGSVQEHARRPQP
jgi:hypothetical protein